MTIVSWKQNKYEYVISPTSPLYTKERIYFIIV